MRPTRRCVLREASKLRCRLVDEVVKFSEVGIAVRVSDERVLEAMGSLDDSEPLVEDLRGPDSSRQPTYESSRIRRVALGGLQRKRAYMIGQGASKRICSQTAPPSC